MTHALILFSVKLTANNEGLPKRRLLGALGDVKEERGLDAGWEKQSGRDAHRVSDTVPQNTPTGLGV